MSAVDVLFRADGGPGIGAGHLMRCLALARACMDRGLGCALVTLSGSAPSAAWSEVGIDVHHLSAKQPGSKEDLAGTLDVLHALGPAWVVADGYGFDADYLSALADRACLLLLDDEGLRDAPVDCVLNPNVGAGQHCAGRYSQARDRLLGEAYFLLRPAIRDVQAKPEPGRVLVTFGADDDENLAFGFLSAAAAAGLEFCADVVCTAPASGLAALRAAATGAPGDLRVHAGPMEIAPLMARAWVIVCAGGGTACEAASLGVPAIVVIRAANQRGGALALRERGAALVAGEGAQALPEAVEHLRGLLADDGRRRDMSVCGRELIDGLGAARVAAALDARGCARHATGSYMQ